MVNIYLWYSKTTRLTGRRLANNLNINHGILPPSSEYTHVICWGARLPKRITEEEKERLSNLTYLNSVFDIEKYVSKIKFYETFKDLIPMPKLYYPREIISNIHSYPPIMMARKDYGMGGKGINLCLQISDLLEHLPNADYFTEFIPTQSEYRVQFFYKRMIRLQTKLRNNERRTKSRWVKSKKNGYKFIRLPQDDSIREELKNFARALRPHIKLNFFAADIIMGDDGKFRLLEINTGMGLGRAGLIVYTKNLQKVIDKWRQRDR